MDALLGVPVKRAWSVHELQTVCPFVPNYLQNGSIDLKTDFCLRSGYTSRVADNYQASPDNSG